MRYVIEKRKHVSPWPLKVVEEKFVKAVDESELCGHLWRYSDYSPKKDRFLERHCDKPGCGTIERYVVGEGMWRRVGQIAALADHLVEYEKKMLIEGEA